jgi:DNA mismatch repair protein MutL
MPIRVLSTKVASQIAAGEVIERPASVVKELLENAIDAGATSIHVEVRQGGRRLMSVADNGCGIPAAEVELAFARHATSKLQDVTDLEHITTLGFRGEALASIASVSQVTLVTRAEGEDLGSRLRIEGTQVVRSERGGHPQGTTVRVENLFYNVPARLKFLRRDATERKHIDALVTRYAMAYPGLRFVLENDGRLSFRSPGSGELLDVLIEVYGLEAAQAMIAIRSDGVGSRSGASKPAPGRERIAVVGYVSQPALHRGTREQITLFVNGRWVRDRGLAFAIEQAYHTLLPVKRYPLAVLNVSLPPQEVDVNVHPTKSEVKFRHRDAVFRAVQRCVREALLAQATIPAAGPLADAGLRTAYQGPAAATQHEISFPRHEAGYRTALGAESQPWFPETPPDQDKLPPLRVLGQMAQCYIVAEGPEGMYLIDQHAAHERVLYERLLAQQATAAVAVQHLLEPLAVELTPAQAEELETWLEPLLKLGFEVEPFGGHTVLVRAIPTTLGRIDVRQTLAGILDDLSLEQTPLADEIDARMAAAACKRGAVKAGQTLDVEEMRALVRQLEETASPRTCPHGRPTMILLGQAWLEREFGRR